MTATKDRFWAKVLFREFIRHFRKLNDEQIVADVRQSMDDLEDLVEESGTFGSKMVRWSMERADQYPMATENGKKGGRPRKNKAGAATSEGADDSKVPPPANLIPCTGAFPGSTSERGAGRGTTRKIQKSGPMPDKDAVRDFALENGLDEVDAYNCWYATVNERGGCDSEGKKVSDWKAYVVAWCRTASEHRKERKA